MTRLPVVLIPDRLSPPPDVELEAFGPDAEILLGQATHPDQITPKTWASADAVLAWHDLRFDSELLDKLDRCRVLVRVGVGFDNVDIAAAGERGIVVCNVPDYGTTDVADHAMALLLTLARGLPAFSDQVRRGGWSWAGAGELRRLDGAVLGIVGLGRIGTATALRARGFGMRVVFHDPYVPDGCDKALGIVRADSLVELLDTCDHVSIHTPLTDETRGLAGTQFFERLKPGAIFVNTARGGIVELDALERALRGDRLVGAGLDVLPEEPPDPAHNLIRAWRDREPWVEHRLIVTPHAAFYCREAYREMRYKAALEARRVLRGQQARNCVNRQWLVSARSPLLNTL